MALDYLPRTALAHNFPRIRKKNNGKKARPPRRRGYHANNAINHRAARGRAPLN